MVALMGDKASVRFALYSGDALHQLLAPAHCESRLPTEDAESFDSLLPAPGVARGRDPDAGGPSCDHDQDNDCRPGTVASGHKSEDLDMELAAAAVAATTTTATTTDSLRPPPLPPFDLPLSAPVTTAPHSLPAVCDYVAWKPATACTSLLLRAAQAIAQRLATERKAHTDAVARAHARLLALTQTTGEP